jgi:conjugative transfer region protein TrbK
VRPVAVWSLTALMVTAAAAIAVGAVRTNAPPPFAVHAASGDPTLRRCRAAGEMAGRDETCQTAWRTARARFFGSPIP